MIEPDLIASRVRTARRLGSDPAFVLHGGGNCSVKTRRTNILGEEEALLLIKGSGWDLATIESAGFTALRLAPVLRLAELATLSDVDMARELASYRVDPVAPAPSVEAIMHALIPYEFVDHTHADAIVTLTNTPRGAELVRETYGSRVLILPYVMPGFDLARMVADCVDNIVEGVEGLVLMNHGVVTFGHTAEESYDRMVALISAAEVALAPYEQIAPTAPALPRGNDRRSRVAELRRAVSSIAGCSMVLSVHDEPHVLAFAQHPEVADISQRGPATPDHVIRTKPVPLIGDDVARFAEEYREYFERGAAQARGDVRILDAAPRIALHPGLGLVSVGRTAVDAAIAGDIYRHTIDIILRAQAAGGYRPVGERDLFDVEYWDLEQAKLKIAGEPRPLAGRVALVTGAASGIGRAIAEKLLAEGAAVLGLDIDPEVVATFSGMSWAGVPTDVTNLGQVEAALDVASDRFGGVDILVVNAGIFPGTTAIAELQLSEWQRVMRVNVDAAVDLLRAAHPLLKRSPDSGKVIVVGSKNVAAPGPGAAAYSASKAALTQLARVTALEWADDGITVNVIHPDAVFDTGLWGDGLLESRATHYGVSVESYRRRNLLRMAITSQDVAELAFAMTGPAFARTTGAQVPIDGGNERVI